MKLEVFFNYGECSQYAERLRTTSYRFEKSVFPFTKASLFFPFVAYVMTQSEFSRGSNMLVWKRVSLFSNL